MVGGFERLGYLTQCRQAIIFRSGGIVRLLRSQPKPIYIANTETVFGGLFVYRRGFSLERIGMRSIRSLWMPLCSSIF